MTNLTVKVSKFVSKSLGITVACIVLSEWFGALAISEQPRVVQP